MVRDPILQCCCAWVFCLAVVRSGRAGRAIGQMRQGCLSCCGICLWMASTALRLGSLTELANLTLARQVEEVRMRAIIVTTHGSQAVSLAFVRACTVVIVLVLGCFRREIARRHRPCSCAAVTFPPTARIGVLARSAHSRTASAAFIPRA